MEVIKIKRGGIAILWVLFLATSSFGQNVSEKRGKVNDFIDNGYFDSAVLLLEEMLDETPKDSLEERAKYHIQIGRILSHTNRDEEALISYGQAMQFAQKQNRQDLVNKAKTDMATTCDRLGQYEKAISLIKEVLVYKKQQGDTAGTANTLLDLALYFYHNQQTEEALESYLEIVALLNDSTELTTKAKAYNQIGNIWADDMKDERKALSYYFKSLELKLRENNYKSISFAYNNIGLSYKVLNRWDSAVYYYTLAVEFAEKSGAREVQILPLLNLGNIYYRQNEYKKALQHYKAAEQHTDLATLRNKVLIYCNLGNIYNKMHRFDSALSYLKIAEPLTVQRADLLDIADVQGYLAETYAGLGNYAEAYKRLAEYSKLKDTLHTHNLNNVVADMLVKYEAEEKDKKILEANQKLLQKEVQTKQIIIWFLAALVIVLLIAAYLYFKFRKKEMLAKQVALELSLQEQKTKNKIQEERLRISRELHDNIGSHLTLINAMTEQVGETDGRAAKVRKSILLSMKELRKTVWLLNKETNSLDEIVIKLRDFLSPVSESGIRLQVTLSGNTEQNLTDIETTHLFRTLQEAANNAIKYAQCTRILINLNMSENSTLSFEVADNGKGFDKEKAAQSNGLANMRYRIEQLKGSLKVLSRPGEGTTIRGEFPVSHK